MAKRSRNTAETEANKVLVDCIRGILGFGTLYEDTFGRMTPEQAAQHAREDAVGSGKAA